MFRDNPADWDNKARPARRPAHGPAPAAPPARPHRHAPLGVLVGFAVAALGAFIAWTSYQNGLDPANATRPRAMSRRVAAFDGAFGDTGWVVLGAGIAIFGVGYGIYNLYHCFERE